jgi:hypothetical protein
MRALAVIAWLALACGTAPESRPIGADCFDENQCGEESKATCITAWPGGYCAVLDCGAGTCPAGSHCVRALSFPSQPNPVCMAACGATSPCRAGYTCVRPSPDKPVCAPNG